MKIHLTDGKSVNECYEIGGSARYHDVWKKIDELIDKHRYSCFDFPIPEINKEKRIITIHWIELFGKISEPYIEILDATDNLINMFIFEIERCKRRSKNDK